MCMGGILDYETCNLVYSLQPYFPWTCHRLVYGFSTPTKEPYFLPEVPSYFLDLNVIVLIIVIFMNIRVFSLLDYEDFIHSCLYLFYTNFIRYFRPNRADSLELVSSFHDIKIGVILSFFFFFFVVAWPTSFTFFFTNFSRADFLCQMICMF